MSVDKAELPGQMMFRLESYCGFNGASLADGGAVKGGSSRLGPGKE